jgi:LPS sulfotransferase NodH
VSDGAHVTPTSWVWVGRKILKAAFLDSVRPATESRTTGEHMKDPIGRAVRSLLTLIRLQTASRLRRTAHGPPARGNIGMFHVGRSGSTVLARMLGQHSQLHWGNELFLKVQSSTPGFRPTPRWVRSVIEAAVQARRCGYFGFETNVSQFGPHCINMSVEEYVRLLQTLGFRHFIVLTRNNLLRVVISYIAAAQAGQWHVVSRPSEPVRVTVNPDRPYGSWAGSLTEILDYYLDYYAELDVQLADYGRLDLSYEADIESDPAVGYQKICRFLDIEPEPSDAPLERTNPFSVEEMILNYDEVSDALRGTRFKWMLTA